MKYSRHPLGSLVTLWFFLATLCFAIGSVPAEGQEKTSPPIAFTHAALTEATLPSPGRMVTLSVSVKRDPVTSNARMRMLIVRDGRLIDVQANGPRVEPNDVVSFSTEIPSPIVELSYQFLLYLPDGRTQISEHYRVMRACMPQIAITKAELEPAERGPTVRASKLLEQSEGLQRELDLYERSLLILGDIKALVEKNS